MSINATIQNFKSESFSKDIKAMSDLYEYHDFRVWGNKEEGVISGFGWIEHDIEFSGVYMPLTVHSVGIIGSEERWNSYIKENTHTVVSGIRYIKRSEYSEKIAVEGEIPAEMLIEYDDKERIIFCGMQEGGKRHGLGVAFTYEDRFVKQHRGIWQNGIKTHCWEHAKFVEL